jgi:hypothetical protein
MPAGDPGRSDLVSAWTLARKPRVSAAHRSQLNRFERANAASALRRRASASHTRRSIAAATLSTRSGSKYSPAPESTSRIGPRSELAMGRPAPMASSRMLGMFSQLDAKTKTSASR